MPLGVADRAGNRRKAFKAKRGEFEDDFSLSPGKDTQPDIKLTAEHIAAFSLHYLQESYDDPVASPECHMEWWEMCCGNSQYVAIAAPRDHAKSTAITHAYTLANVLFRQRRFVVIISSTYDIAVEFLRAISLELAENDRLRADFGIHKFIKDAENNLIVQCTDGYKFRIVAKGSEQKMRGLKWGSKRPDMMLFDDCEDDEQVESKERRLKFSRWVMRAAIPAGAKGRCIYRVVGTVLHFDSFLEACLKDPTWTSKRYKAHRSFDDFTDILWPERYDEAWFRAKRASFVARGDPDGYSQEYLNNPISEQDAYFHRADLVPFPDRFDPLDPSLTRYVGWDFAVSKEEQRDFTVGVVIGVDKLGHKYVLEVFRERVDSMGIIDEMVRIQRIWRPEFHAVEQGTIEKSIEPFLNEKMRKTHTYLNLVKIVSSKDKLVRCRSWQAAVRARHVFYDHRASWWPGLEEEMVRFPRAEHDDMVDAQSILGRLLEYLMEGQDVPTDEDERLLEIEEQAMMVAQQAIGAAMGRDEVTGY